MKKLHSLIAMLLLLSTLLTSCGVYNPAVDPNDTPGVTDPDNPGGDSPGGSDDPVNPDDPNTPEDEDRPYTVRLNVNGKAYTPNAANGPYYVQWSNGFSIHTAELVDGVAEIYGLDDDYTVTLLDIPSGYAYNANAYLATADERDVSIELIKPIRTSGSGADLYSSIIEISKIGVYQTTLSTDRHTVFYQFHPNESGTYVIESWADITQNNINPDIDIYRGTFANKYFYKTIDGQGAESTYTKNFRYEIEVDDSMIGNVYAFGIKATAKDGIYPTTVTFAISKDGEYDIDYSKAELMIPQETLTKTPNYSSLQYTLTGPEINEGGNNVFHGEMFKLWKKGTGMPMVSLDGERGNELTDKLSGSYGVFFVNPKTGRQIVRTIVFTPTDELSGWVEITEEDKMAKTTSVGKYTYKVCKDHVFTNLSDKDCNLCGCARNEDTKAVTPPSVSVIFQSGVRIEYAGFTFDINGEIYYGTGDNFYHFYDEANGTWGEILYAYVSAPCRFIDLPFTTIEYQGNKNLTVNGGTQNYKFFIEGMAIASMGYFCVNHQQNQVFCPCLDTCGGICYGSCSNCHPQCRIAPEELKGKTGYADFTNQDGVYGVTEELKDFLQKYSVAQLLFRDGNGHVETNPDVKVYSNEDDQWLFACAYYEKK